MKKRATQYDGDEDLFDSPPVADDLFGSFSIQDEHASMPSSTKAEAKSGRKPFAEEFAEQHAFVTARIGPNAAMKHPLVRQNALRRLLHVSGGKGELEKVADLLVAWRDSGRIVDKGTAVEFIGESGPV